MFKVKKKTPEFSDKTSKINEILTKGPTDLPSYA